MKRATLALTFLLVASGLATQPSGAAATARPGRYVVVLNPGTEPDAVANEHSHRFGAQPAAVYRSALRAYSGTIPDDQVARVKADPRVAFVEEDVTFTATGTRFPPPEEIPQVTTRTVRRIDGDKSTTVSGNGSGSVGVNIAVLDTGIAVHPDLNVVGGVDCTSNKGYDDLNGHGTIVAGVAGARDNSIDIVGVAPNARLFAVRVLNQNLGASLSQVLCGVDWVTSTRTDADRTNDIVVANMSLGSPGSDDGNCGRTNKDALHLAICGAVGAGVTIVAAAGNSAADLAGFVPAAYDEVLTATAMADTDGQPGGSGPALACGTDTDDTPASFSNFASSADAPHVVAAPGFCVSSTYPGPNVAVDSGTSYAAPHVSGVVALCIVFGPCAGQSPAAIVRQIVTDASTYSQRHPSYGFAGDPQHPTSARVYGPLVRAGSY